MLGKIMSLFEQKMDTVRAYDKSHDLYIIPPQIMWQKPLHLIETYLILFIRSAALLR